jgi:Putative auto-transporter adhesin, head GIN domain
MKKISLFVVIFFCISAAYAQKKEVRDVATFTKLGFGGSGTLYLKQGSPQRVELEGTSELLEKYETKVEDGKLSIRPKDRWNDWNWGKEDKLIVYITVKDIESIGVAGSGDVIAQTKLVSDKLNLKVSGSGNLKAEVAVSNDLEADVSGSGNVEVKGNAGSFDSDISGSGNVEASLVITGNAQVGIAGSGKITIDGSAEKLEARISGSGSVRGENFEVEKCMIKIAGSGNVDINVKEELEANIAGSGDVRYKGNPKRVNNNSSGSGSVRKM